MIIKKNQQQQNKPTCGLCGSSKKLTKTECCDNWICDDEDSYVLHSFARNSCYRNHDRYTLCGFHYHNNHSGEWQDCKACKDAFDLSDYVDRGTNAYNFEVLKDPEKVTIKCVNCGFTGDNLDGFAYRTSRGDFCAKPRCQKAALAVFKV